MPFNTKKKILIVGAGASGLPSIRHALLYNTNVVCFEGSDEIGGLWKYKPHETELSSVMKSTVINTSKEMTAYSDFPPEAKMANFMNNREMHRYLSSYAKNFELEKFIKFHHKVISIDRTSDFDKTGKWNVKYSNEEGTHEEVFDGVLLCNGHHAASYMPEPFLGQDQFKGRIIHSHSYKDHRGYEDKNVVVVGIGNSGADVAVELSRIAKQVYLVTRRGTWVINRIFDFGEPVDLAMNKKFDKDLKELIPISINNAYVEHKLNSRFDHKAYGLKPKHSVYGAHPTVNDELPNRIACGTVKIKPNIKKFGEHSVEFEDGSVVDHVDEVVMATGFSFEFDLVEHGKLITVKDNNVNLYKNMYPIELSHHNTLAVVGLIQPLGSIMPLSEIQARVYFEVLFGKIALPTKVEMANDLKMKQEAIAKRYVTSRRHTIQVDYMDYIEEMAGLIGSVPDMKSLWLTDPVLASKIYFGPRVPYIYRLFGPNKWDKAGDAIFGVEERVLKGTCENAMIEKKSNLYFYGAAVVVLLLAIYFVF